VVGVAVVHPNDQSSISVRDEFLKLSRQVALYYISSV
jgi:hypothetical protein